LKDSTGIILVLAYPETVVMVADEWYSRFLKYFGIGKKDYVRAGHAALVLIDRTTGILEYHDFGRYITPEPYARARGKSTDHELAFPIKANIVDGTIENLNQILEFLATHPKLTHGEGKLVASVCNAINYGKARKHITMIQERHFIRYAAFIKDASNCARFVNDALITSVNDIKIKKKLIRSKWFTPSTVGNVLIADTQNKIYQVSDQGEIQEFKSTVWLENKKYFLDNLSDYVPNLEGTIKPKKNHLISGSAQWLGGIAAGAWYDLDVKEDESYYMFKRISPAGMLDVEGLYEVNDSTFDFNGNYNFVHYSNCQFFHIKQNNEIYRFDLIEKIN